MCVVDAENWVARDLGTQNHRQVDKFCADCGSPVLLRCPSCRQPFRGHRRGDTSYRPDDFCRECGGAFPWTSREGKAARLRDLLANEELDDQGRMEAQEALDLLTVHDESVSDEQKRRALEKLKALTSVPLWKLAAPILTSFVSAELRRQAGLPPG